MIRKNETISSHFVHVHDNIIRKSIHTTSQKALNMLSTMSAPVTDDGSIVETRLRSHEAHEPYKQSLPDPVVIPDLFVSFVAQKPQLNPHYERTKAESEAWMVM